MKIALLNIENSSKKVAMNKDLAGGMGTFSDFGSSLTSRLISYTKSKAVKIPVLAYAYLLAILKQLGHEVDYIEETETIDHYYDLVLINGTIVDYRYEMRICLEIKKQFPKTRTIFWGALPTVAPELFSDADHVIIGEAEAFFLYHENHTNFDFDNQPKIIRVNGYVKMDDLPTPDFDHFPISSYSYSPAINKKPVLTLQGSRGCPYSCAYYCPYAAIQGSKYRVRSPEKVYNDIKVLVRKHKIKAILFRDPTFGMTRDWTVQLCNLLIVTKLK